MLYKKNLKKIMDDLKIEEDTYSDNKLIEEEVIKPKQSDIEK